MYKTDGITPKSWVNIFAAHRKANGIDNMHPWCSRSDVMIRGCTPQPTGPSFIKEILDCRYLAFCSRTGTSLNASRADLPSRLFTDVRHDIHHQLADGSMVMQTSSMPYWHAGDRVAMPLEFFAHNGYDIDSLNVSDINVVPQDWPAEDTEADRQPQPAKKRRVSRSGRSGLVSTKLTDLAANGMCLPDVFTIIYTSLLSTDSDLWENAPHFDYFGNFRANASSGSTDGEVEPEEEDLTVEDLHERVKRMLAMNGQHEELLDGGQPEGEASDDGSERG